MVYYLWNFYIVNKRYIWKHQQSQTHNKKQTELCMLTNKYQNQKYTGEWIEDHNQLPNISSSSSKLEDNLMIQDLANQFASINIWLTNIDKIYSKPIINKILSLDKFPCNNIFTSVLNKYEIINVTTLNNIILNMPHY